MSVVKCTLHYWGVNTFTTLTNGFTSYVDSQDVRNMMRCFMLIFNYYQELLTFNPIAFLLLIVIIIYRFFLTTYREYNL